MSSSVPLNLFYRIFLRIHIFMYAPSPLFLSYYLISIHHPILDRVLMFATSSLLLSLSALSPCPYLSLRFLFIVFSDFHSSSSPRTCLHVCHLSPSPLSVSLLIRPFAPSLSYSLSSIHHPPLRRVLMYAPSPSVCTCSSIDASEHNASLTRCL